jgi:hypothetical protein
MPAHIDGGRARGECDPAPPVSLRSPTLPCVSVWNDLRRGLFGERAAAERKAWT